MGHDDYSAKGSRPTRCAGRVKGMGKVIGNMFWALMDWVTVFLIVLGFMVLIIGLAGDPEAFTQTMVDLFGGSP